MFSKQDTVVYAPQNPSFTQAMAHATTHCVQNDSNEYIWVYASATCTHFYGAPLCRALKVII